MAPFTAIALLALAALTQTSLATPNNHPNGVYEAHVGDDGFPVFSRIGNLTTPPAGWIVKHPHQASSAKFHQKRGGPEHVVCNDQGITLAYHDINLAAYSLATACDAAVSSGRGDSFVPARGYHVALVNDIAAYVCNFAHAKQHCLSSEVQHDLSAVEAQCWDSEGYFAHPDWAKGYGYAYFSGRYNFCAGKESA